MKIKALSLHQPWAELIASGVKTIETRTWATHHRGELLICSTQRPCDTPGVYYGSAVALVDLIDCRHMTEADEQAAGCKLYYHAFAWVLGNIRRIVPFAVRGKHRLFDVDTVRLVVVACTEAPP